jgi:hypothetical protein
MSWVVIVTLGLLVLYFARDADKKRREAAFWEDSYFRLYSEVSSRLEPEPELVRVWETQN